MKLRTILVAALALVLGACEPPQPNIVLIVTDDQRADTLQYMAAVQEHLVAEGFQAVNAFTPVPTCCPSRASILTGQYAFNHGTTNNDAGALLFDPSNTLAVWLRDAGYTTGLFGKYLNNYDELAPAVPPGWDRFVAFAIDDASLSYYNYVLAEDGVLVNYGAGAADYSTDRVGGKALDFIDEAAEPFFVVFTPFAPHSINGAPPTPAPRHVGLYDTLPCDFAPEINMTDKPQWLRDYAASIAPIQAAELAQTCERKRRGVEALQAVDEFVAALVAQLAAADQLDDTIIIFTSDNGIEEREHWWAQKNVLYEAAIRVPFVVRYYWWGGIRPVMLQQPVLTLDIAPTLAQLADVAPGAPVDGFPLQALFVPASPWRDDFLLEYYHHTSFPWMNIPSALGVRSATLKYIISNGGFEELYDLATDPQEWNNLAVTAPSDPRLQQMRDRLVELLVE